MSCALIAGGYVLAKFQEKTIDFAHVLFWSQRKNLKMAETFLMSQAYGLKNFSLSNEFFFSEFKVKMLV